MSARLERWGDPGTGRFGRHPFGLQATGHGRFDGVSIPTQGRVGWFVGNGSERFAEGEFFRYEISEMRPATADEEVRAREKRTGGHLPASNFPWKLSNTSRDDDRANAGAPAQAMRVIAASLGFRTASAHQSFVFSRALIRGAASTARADADPGVP